MKKMRFQSSSIAFIVACLSEHAVVCVGQQQFSSDTNGPRMAKGKENHRLGGAKRPN